MKDYLKSSLREDPNHFILHTGTKDLSTERSPELIANSIVDLAIALKSVSSNASASNIILCTDK